jgi:hypothetical protein
MNDSNKEHLHLGADEATRTMLKECKEYGLDRTLSETFPCSDSLSSIPDPISHPS